MTTETETLVRPAGSRPVARRSPGLPARRWRSLLKHVGLVALCVVMVYPLIWLVVSSFKPNDEIFRDLSIFTTSLTTDNYATLVESAEISETPNLKHKKCVCSEKKNFLLAIFAFQAR